MWYIVVYIPVSHTKHDSVVDLPKDIFKQTLTESADSNRQRNKQNEEQTELTDTITFRLIYCRTTLRQT